MRTVGNLLRDVACRCVKLEVHWAGQELTSAFLPDISDFVCLRIATIKQGSWM